MSSHDPPRSAHGTGVAISLLSCLPFWAGVIWFLSSCAVVETAVTLEARALYPIPAELRIKNYELQDGLLIADNEAIAFYKPKLVGSLQAHCVEQGAGWIGWAAVGCAYWQAGDVLPTIVVHTGAADYTIRHEGAHALAMLAGWGPSTLTEHWGEPP